MGSAKPLAATARGLLAGAAGGVAAACVDYAMSAKGAAQFMPDGSARLGLFLVGAYGATGAICGAALGLIASLLVAFTDLGAWWRSAFLDEDARQARRTAAVVPTVEGSRRV